MQLFYTGAFKQGEEQQNPVQSLGGYVSSSQIPNNVSGNLFSSIDTIEPKTVVRGIAFYNESTSPLTGLKLWIDLPEDNVGHYEVAIVALAEDDCGFYMERIQNENATPYLGVFASVDGEDNALEIGSMDAESYYGLWIRRTLNSETANDFNNCDALYIKYQAEEALPENETMSLSFSWD